MSLRNSVREFEAMEPGAQHLPGLQGDPYLKTSL